jgi:hypothetical protein
MISAIVFVSDTKRQDVARERERLARSLVWLVSAVVAGVVRDVTLAGPATLRLADIAEQTGCAMVEAEDEASRLAKAIGVARYSRLLLVESAFQPGDSMICELDSLARAMPPDASARLLGVPRTPWQRLFPDRAPTVGLFAPARRCGSLAGRDFKGLQAGLGARIVFSTRAMPID